MEMLKGFVIFGDVLMAAITAWFLWKNARDVDSVVGFSLMIFLFLASAGLILWRWP